ncbi:hypothetical protein [Oscillibacter sp.]|uniref:hypothetical protein n=1 Tax=Oscillibacter sp. TaxID=1945593 RepID=UPI0033915679
MNAFLAIPLAKPVAATPMLLLGGLLPHMSVRGSRFFSAPPSGPQRCGGLNRFPAI